MRVRPSIPVRWLSSIVPTVLLGLILSSTPATVTADVLCTQFGFDTFQVGSTVQFEWNDNQAVPISSFNLDLFCFENGKLLKTLATLNTATSVSPQNWTVDNSILSFHNDCPLNQYQGVFDWTTTDPTTGAATGTGSSKCKAMLLNGPGVIPAPGTIDPSQQPQDEDPTSGTVVVSDRTKTIVIGVGCAVGALVLAGFVGFYYIRIKNKRAEQDLANKKLREPLQATDHDNHHAPSPGSGSIADGSAIVEMTPVSMGPPGTLVMEQERPISILTSSFSPPEDTYEKQQRVQREQEQQQQVYEQQLQQQHHQQQLQHQQQMQMQQQQQTYGGYNGY
ncbi:hypothetical protein CPB97_005065 [Podila verticillata]|nr:hypothetical protein CPB97_005065 [Podila verticillata]